MEGHRAAADPIAEFWLLAEAVLLASVKVSKSAAQQVITRRSYTGHEMRRFLLKLRNGDGRHKTLLDAVSSNYNTTYIHSMKTIS